MAEHRLSDRKYAETEFLFQTIEMAKSDEEYDVDLSTTPPPSADFEDLDVVQKQQPIIQWKFVTRRPRRRYTVSHGTPPAPPSTPTASGTPTPTPTASSTAQTEEERIASILYILDYVPKYKNKLKDQQRTDAELAELFNVVTITGGTSTQFASDTKSSSERGISAASRAIRKQDANRKLFKIHRNPKQVSRDPDEEDSISAPEYDTEEEDLLYRRRRRDNPLLGSNKRRRRFARFEHQERMDHVLDTFDTAMSFNNA